ncbi:hemolysin family protein [Halosimplex sp. J119]
MSTLVTAARLLGGVFLLLSNGFFVAIEFAMTRVRQFPESEFEGNRGLERAWEMTEKLEIYLSGCQVGITISSVSLGVVAEPAATAVIAGGLQTVGLAAPQSGHTTLSIALSLALINVLHVIVGEQTPTYFGVERTKTAAKYGAPVLYWWSRLTYPIIYLADRVAKGILRQFGITIARSWTEGEAGEELPSSRSELRRQMGESLGNLGLSDERQDEVLNALRIGEMSVEEVMVPREEIVALSTEDSVESAIETMGSSPNVRFPLVGEDLEDFVGVVYTPEVIGRIDELESGEVTVEDLAAPPMTVSPDVNVSDLIDQFQTNNQELALVLSEGVVEGLVTATDAFEAIAGDLEDPMDKEME